MNNSIIEIYKTENGETEISVTLDNDTVWLNLFQLTKLFQRDKSVISRHISNIFKEKELDINSVVAKNETTAKDGKIYQVDYYNLDVIISIGYRIKCQRGTQFRIWANNVLKEYLIKGFILNERLLTQKTEQLKELQQSVKMLGTVLSYKTLTNDESVGLLRIISDYAYALDILDRYEILFDVHGNKRIADNALVALTLMIAISKPEEKNTMIKVIVSLINKKN